MPSVRMVLVDGGGGEWEVHS